MKSKKIKYKYTLLVNEGAYFANTIYGLISEVLSHRFHHWKRVEGWTD